MDIEGDLIQLAQGLCFLGDCFAWGLVAYYGIADPDFLSDNAPLIAILLFATILIIFVGYAVHGKKGIMIVLGALIGSALLGTLPNTISVIRCNVLLSQANALGSQGKYVEAADLLMDPPECRMKEKLKTQEHFYRIYQYYSEGNIDKAEKELLLFDYLGGKAQFISERAFLKRVDEEYIVWKEAERAREEKAYRENLHNRLPFVGMGATYLSDTSLGEPYPVTVNKTKRVKGYDRPITVTIHSYLKYGRIVMTAACYGGKVVEIHDFRKNPQSAKTLKGDIPYLPWELEKRNTRTPSHSSSSSFDNYDDPYNARDYVDAWDFYEDNYDDFDNFEDAEMYYYNKNR